MISNKINRKTNPAGLDEDGVNSYKVSLPLGTEFALDMHSEMLSNEMYFEKIKNSVLPPITDMEKIVVYPAVYGGLDEENKPILSLADEIEINLHFRKRWFYRGTDRILTDGWLTNDIYGWTTGQTGDDEGKEFDGSDFNPENYDERSDLVGYLGFDDDDIYYQKSKVKKSFIRLLYYDSNDVLNKNLLTYSTSFLDSGKLFSKYCLIRNNSELFKYVQDSDVVYNEMALFEPGRQYDKRKSGDAKKEEIESNLRYDTLRLSSRITLKDKYNDDASSDGFYLYLFRQDAPSEIPDDLYLKAEFNNAKYGKTVNLMLPVGKDGVPVRFGDEADSGATSGDSGATEGFPMDFIIEDESGNTKFDFERYYNSLFINVKYKFERTLNKYVYYFPWDPAVQREKMEEAELEYTVSNDEEKKKITLNFFEPRVNRAKNIKINEETNGGS